MENKDWINDYKLLKQVSPANPFTVPAGYFDDLGDRIASLKNIEEYKQDNPEGGFAVPEGYFEELASNIQSRVAIETAINKEDAGFGVPDGYFEELSLNIQSRIAIDETVTAIDNGFAVPEGYFEELSSNIQGRIAVEETVVAGDAGFAVPDGYFEKLNQSILNKTVTAVDVKRKGVVRKLFASTAFKYATAACFAVAVGGGILLTQLSNPANEHKNSFLHKQLANVPLDDIKSYLMLNVDAGDTQQTVASEGATVNDSDLKNALQNYADSVQ